MTIRMTLTAATLGAMTLAGCSSMNGGDKMMTAPAATTPSTVMTAPVVTTPGVELKTLSNNGSAGQALAAPEVIAVQSGGVEIERVSGNGSSGDPFTTELIRTRAAGTPEIGSVAATPGAGEGQAQIQREADFSDAAMMKDDGMMMKDDGAMSTDAMAAGDAAFNACFANGGQVVNFIGDPTGETMACETDGVQTIL